MLIRSQGKNFLIMPENYKAIVASVNGEVLATNTLEGDDHCFCVARNNGYADSVVLGRYSTDSKAEKVLDMIQHFYCQTSQIQGDVFGMPQDSEVDEC